MRQKIFTGDGDPRHGTTNGYSNLGCRCDECKTAHADYHREYMHGDPDRLRRHANRERIRKRREKEQFKASR